MLPHQSCVVVRHRAVAVVGVTHRIDVICPVLPRAGTGYFGVGAYTLIALRLAGVGKIEGRRYSRPSAHRPDVRDKRLKLAAYGAIPVLSI